MILVSIVNVWFIIPTAIMAIILYGFRHVYVSASRSIKRVESVLRSPIFAHTNATLQGLSTIRAFNAENSVKKNFNNHMDISSSVSSTEQIHNRVASERNFISQAWFMFLSITRCFAFWLDLVCVIYIAVITYAFVQMDSSNIPGGNVGLAITQVISLVGLTQWGIRQTSELENQMVSVERVLEYANLPSEDGSGNAEKMKTPAGWPSEGTIKFNDLSLYYNDESRPAIKNLNFTILSKEKIGIVGRTRIWQEFYNPSTFPHAENQRCDYHRWLGHSKPVPSRTAQEHFDHSSRSSFVLRFTSFQFGSLR